MAFRLILLLGCIVSTTLAIFAAEGDLDPTFGSGGWVVATIPGAEAAVDVAIQSDGKIVMVTSIVGADNSSDFLVFRLNQNGSTDTGFGTGGKVAIPFDIFGNENGAAIAIQSDGKILIAGSASLGNPSWDFAVARVNANGTLDDTFGTGGKVKIPVSAGADYASDVAIQSDGKIVIVGKSREQPNDDASIARLNADGTLDTTFNGTGKRVFPIGAGAANDFLSKVILQADGKIIAVGGNDDDFAVIRLNANGSFDPTFDGDGIVTTPIGTQRDEAYAVTLQSDGKIIAGGSANSGSGNRGALVRYNGNGSLDTSFNGSGKVVFSQPIDLAVFKSITIQPGGKILAAGVGGDATFHGNFVLARYNNDGMADGAFGTNGYVRTTFGTNDTALYSAAQQRDGKIVAVGSGRIGGGDYSFAAVRYLMDAIPSKQSFDYDGDHKSDISVFRPSDGNWYLQQSTVGFLGFHFGLTGDKITPADYDGDGKTDIAVYRPTTGVWYIFNSSNSTVSYSQFGIAEDLPTAADYDGDGKADVSVFRPSMGTWYRLNSSNGSFFAQQFGINEDKPTVGDFDGDGRADVAVFRPSSGVWYRLNSLNGSFYAEQFGISSDLLTPADYDDDGKTDIAVYRPSTGVWYVHNSTNAAFVYTNFGLAEDIPAPGDFDGDGKADICVFRPSQGTWYRLNSSNGSFFAYQFGTNGDQPTQAAFRY